MCIKSLQEHEKMLDALKARDADQYKEMVAQHNAKAKERAINLLMTDMEKWFFVP